MTSILPPPSFIIGHDQFGSWYQGQDRIVSRVMDWMANPKKRFLCASIPTGSGKSVIAMVTAKLAQKRAITLTATKGLQEQLMTDFERIGLVDIRGQNSYQCIQDSNLTVDDGACHAGMYCQHKNLGCLYYDQLQRAKNSNLVITNYYYYLAQTEYADGLGTVPLLIMDEAHLAFRALESHMSCFIERSEVTGVGGEMPNPTPETWTDWRSWANTITPKATEAEADVMDEIEHYKLTGQGLPTSVTRHLKQVVALQRKLMVIALSKGDWVWERRGRGFYFTPIWPGQQYSNKLFRGSPKVIVMSAILTPKTADSLGIPENEREWLNVDSFYPPQNTPVAHVNTIRVNARATDGDMRLWVNKIDQVIDRRMDRKGILFTVSYDRRNFFMQNTRHQNLVWTHSSDDTIAVVRNFKAAPAPAILVSPAVTSGWDFPGDECRYIIVGKIPYPDTRGPVMQARTKDDKDWSAFMAMETLVQEGGRGTRSGSDKCEVLIMDDSWLWWWAKYKEFAPDWFKRRIVSRQHQVPNPLI